MTHSNRLDPEPMSADLAALAGWASAATAWGDLSFDQADGFASPDEVEQPASDVSDDRGYGFGV